MQRGRAAVILAAASTGNTAVLLILLPLVGSVFETAHRVLLSRLSAGFVGCRYSAGSVHAPTPTAGSAFSWCLPNSPSGARHMAETAAEKSMTYHYNAVRLAMFNNWAAITGWSCGRPYLRYHQSRRASRREIVGVRLRERTWTRQRSSDTSEVANSACQDADANNRRRVERSRFAVNCGSPLQLRSLASRGGASPGALTQQAETVDGDQDGRPFVAGDA